MVSYWTLYRGDTEVDCTGNLENLPTNYDRLTSIYFDSRIYESSTKTEEPCVHNYYIN